MKKVIALSLLSLALSGCFKNPTYEVIELSKDHWISHFSGDKTQEYKECIQTKKFNPKNQNLLLILKKCVVQSIRLFMKKSRITS